MTPPIPAKRHDTLDLCSPGGQGGHSWSGRGPVDRGFGRQNQCDALDRMDLLEAAVGAAPLRRRRRQPGGDAHRVRAPRSRSGRPGQDSGRTARTTVRARMRGLTSTFCLTALARGWPLYYRFPRKPRYRLCLWHAAGVNFCPDGTSGTLRGRSGADRSFRLRRASVSSGSSSWMR